MVMNMSTEEFQSALEEVKSLLSDKSINFLSRKKSNSLQPEPHQSLDEDKQQNPSPNVLPIQGGDPIKDDGINTSTVISSVDSVRFNLNGCIVIDPAIVMNRMVEELSQLIKPLEPHDELHSIAQACIDDMMPLALTSQDDPDLHDKFFMFATSSSSSHSSPSNNQEETSFVPLSVVDAPSEYELRHHQHEPHRIGYNFSEINEVMRC